jgi:hypothetical protein
MADHLSQFFPAHCEGMGAAGLSRFIQTNINRALGYGIERERDVCKFLDVGMALGEDFDRSGKYPWSCEILEDEWLAGEEKVDRLVQTALRYEQGGQPVK